MNLLNLANLISFAGNSVLVDDIRQGRCGAVMVKVKKCCCCCGSEAV